MFTEFLIRKMNISLQRKHSRLWQIWNCVKTAKKMPIFIPWKANINDEFLPFTIWHCKRRWWWWYFLKQNVRTSFVQFGCTYSQNKTPRNIIQDHTVTLNCHTIQFKIPLCKTSTFNLILFIGFCSVSKIGYCRLWNPFAYKTKES